MKSMSYGVMPTREEFDAAFEKSTPDGFSFGNDKRVGNCILTADELWAELEKAHAEGIDHAWTWASDVLLCLGFEWI
jgi:hypothetical protein